MSQGGSSAASSEWASPTYIPELLDDVLASRINPGLVFDYTTDLDNVVGAYEAMDERRAIKSLLRVSDR